MTKFKEWPDHAIDLLVGGTPCQSFSVAGLRKGLADPRGNLMLTYLAIADRYRPRWLVWENVPGVLSADGGRAFGTLLGGLAQLGYGFAYRVLDAQYFGVPQRRRRVFVVGYLGDWRRAAAVLFERHSLSGHPAPRREAGEDASERTGFSTVGSVTQRYGAKLGTDESCQGSVTPSLWSITPSNSNTDYNARPTDKAQAVTTGGNRPSARGGDLLAFSCRDYGADVGEISPTPRSMGHDGSHANGGGQIGVATQSAVRRLTPRECERLQGFPDDYTLIPYRGKPAADGPRYKALGNSMAVPVMRWIGERIAEVDKIISPPLK